MKHLVLVALALMVSGCATDIRHTNAQYQRDKEIARQAHYDAIGDNETPRERMARHDRRRAEEIKFLMGRQTGMSPNARLREISRLRKEMIRPDPQIAANRARYDAQRAVEVRRQQEENRQKQERERVANRESSGVHRPWVDGGVTPDGKHRIRLWRAPTSVDRSASSKPESKKETVVYNDRGKIVDPSEVPVPVVKKDNTEVKKLRQEIEQLDKIDAETIIVSPAAG